MSLRPVGLATGPGTGRPKSYDAAGRRAALAALIVLALGLRLWRIDDQSFWFDEAFSVVHARAGLWQILSAGFAWETNPPLYYFLLKAWIGLFGDGEATARSLSALIGAATVPVIFAIGRKLDSPRAGLIAALLFALAILQINYGQEARQYALLVLALSVALLAAAAAVDRAADGRPPRWAGCLFAGGITTAVYSHDIAVLYWASLDLVLLVPVLLSSGVPPAARRRFVGAWAGYNAIAVLLTAPQLYAIYLLRAAPAVDHIATPSLDSFGATVQAILFSEFADAWPVGGLGAAIVLAALAWSAIVNRRRPLIMSIGLLLPLVSLALIAGISLARPVMLVRTILWVPVPLYVFLGVAIAAIRPPVLQAVALGVAVAFTTVAAVVDRQDYAKEQWREIVPLIAGQFRDGDVLFFATPSIHPFVYYWPGAFDFTRCRLPAGYVAPTSPVGDQLKYRCRAESIPEILREMPPGAAAWFVGRWRAVPGLTHLADRLSRTHLVVGRTWISNYHREIIVLRVTARH